MRMIISAPYVRKLNLIMKMNLRLLTVAAVASTLQLAAAGDITGKITLKGNPAPEKELPLDPTCGKLHAGAKPTTRFYVVDKAGGLADVFVTLKVAGGKSTGEGQKPLVIDQVGCEYTPYVSAVQTKQKILAKNSDPVLHNVHATPIVYGNKEFNKAQLPKGPDIESVFEKPELFLRFKCDVHPWMFAYVSIVDHPYFAVSGKDGKFTLKNVPDGKYTIEVYHRKAAPAPSPVTKEIEVKGGSVTADFTLEVK
jgi:hypothetical protein